MDDGDGSADVSPALPFTSVAQPSEDVAEMLHGLIVDGVKRAVQRQRGLRFAQRIGGAGERANLCKTMLALHCALCDCAIVRMTWFRLQPH
jgi:hypothetical protein